MDVCLKIRMCVCVYVRMCMYVCICNISYSVLEGACSDTSSDKARDVSHVSHEDGADAVADLAHAGVVVGAGVCRSAGDDELGAEGGDDPLEFCIVDEACLLVQVVGHGLPEQRCRRHTLLGAHVPVCEAA